MCIRDSGRIAFDPSRSVDGGDPLARGAAQDRAGAGPDLVRGASRLRRPEREFESRNPTETGRVATAAGELSTCLLYTSDAADERSSVDLGGRRIFTKKKKNKLRTQCYCTHHQLPTIQRMQRSWNHDDR